MFSAPDRRLRPGVSHCLQDIEDVWGAWGLLLQPLVSAPCANQYSTTPQTHIGQNSFEREQVPRRPPRGGIPCTGGFLAAFDSSHQPTGLAAAILRRRLTGMHSIGAVMAALCWKDRQYGVVKSVGMALF